MVQTRNVIIVYIHNLYKPLEEQIFAEEKSDSSVVTGTSKVILQQSTSWKPIQAVT